jgi:hypothetical protein
MKVDADAESDAQGKMRPPITSLASIDRSDERIPNAVQLVGEKPKIRAQDDTGAEERDNVAHEVVGTEAVGQQKEDSSAFAIVKIRPDSRNGIGTDRPVRVIIVDSHKSDKAVVRSDMISSLSDLSAVFARSEDAQRPTGDPVSDSKENIAFSESSRLSNKDAMGAIRDRIHFLDTIAQENVLFRARKEIHRKTEETFLALTAQG